MCGAKRGLRNRRKLGYRPPQLWSESHNDCLIGALALATMMLTGLLLERARPQCEATASSGQPTDSEPRHTRRRRRVLHDPTPRLHDRAVALGRARPARRQLGRALEPAVDDHARAGLAGSLLFSSGGIGTLRKLTHVAQGAHHWDLREHKPEHDQPACACTGEEISPQTPRQRTPALTNPVQTTAHPRRARRSQAPRPPPRCSRLPWEPGASWRARATDRYQTCAPRTSDETAAAHSAHGLSRFRSVGTSTCSFHRFV